MTIISHITDHILDDQNEKYFVFLKEIKEFIPQNNEIEKIILLKCKNYIYSKVDTSFTVSPFNMYNTKHLEEVPEEVLNNFSLIKLILFLNDDYYSKFQGFLVCWIKNQNDRLKKKLVRNHLSKEDIGTIQLIIKALFSYLCLKNSFLNKFIYDDLLIVLEQTNLEVFNKYCDMFLGYYNISIKLLKKQEQQDKESLSENSKMQTEKTSMALNEEEKGNNEKVNTNVYSSDDEESINPFYVRNPFSNKKSSKSSKKESDDEEYDKIEAREMLSSDFIKDLKNFHINELYENSSIFNEEDNFTECHSKDKLNSTSEFDSNGFVNSSSNKESYNKFQKDFLKKLEGLNCIQQSLIFDCIELI